MSNESSTLFRPLMANQHLTVLLLIENSEKMFFVWQELRDRYLTPLIDVMARASNNAATSLSVIESSMDSTITPYASRPYPPNQSALSNVKFNFNLDGRVSPSRVNDCIEHLDETYGADASSVLHLVIVAASAPSENCAGLHLPDSGNYTPWTLLAEKLTERGIHCHLVMVPGHDDVRPLTFLFEQTLHLQNHVEEMPPFPVDQLRFIFRLSARPLHYPLCDPESAISKYPAVQSMGTASRRNSYLLDPQSDVNLAPSVTSFTTQNEISLVSQLKMAQGLIKKKQHSKDPQPAPFFGDARLQDAPSQSYPVIPSSSPPSVASPSSVSPSASSMASTSSPSSGSSSSLSSVPLTSRHRRPQPLAMSFGTNPEAIPTNGGRTMSVTKAERLQRISHASSGSSPTESIHTHARRASQIQVTGAAAIGGIMGTPGQGALNGTWFPPNTHVPQRGSPLSTPEQDAAIASPTSSSSSSTLGSGSGSASGTIVVAPSGGNVLGVGLNMGMGSGSVAVPEVGSSVPETFASTPPSVPMATSAVPNGMHQDMSPGSGSSYVGSDMSGPTTPASMEELYMQPLQHQGHGITYQQGANQQNTAIANTQDNMWMAQRQQQHSFRLHQLQEMQMLQQEQHLQQASAMPQQPRYPSAYDPATSTYFPPLPQQYYLPQQKVSPQARVGETFQPIAVPGSESVQDTQATMQQHRAPVRHPQSAPQPFNPYPVHGNPVSASPPPMIVPSQSHVPLTAVTHPTGIAATNPVPTAPIQGRMGANRSPPRSVPSHAPTGRARANTMTGGISKGAASVPSLSKSGRSKKHKKSASSASHSASTLSADSKATSSNTTAAPSSDEVFKVSPLYAASTGVLFESMFNIKSSLLDGPGALANPEDVAIVAPALGVGKEGVEGTEVLTTLPLGTVEAAGGLFRSSIRERGAIVDEAAGTAVVPVPAVTYGPPGSLPGDTSTTSAIPAAMTMVGQSLTAPQDLTMMSTVLLPTAMSGPTFSIPSIGVGNLVPPNPIYQQAPQEVSQLYGMPAAWSS